MIEIELDREPAEKYCKLTNTPEEFICAVNGCRVALLKPVILNVSKIELEFSIRSIIISLGICNSWIELLNGSNKITPDKGLRVFPW